MELQMYVGASDPGDEAEIVGSPNLKLTIPGGTHGDIATAAVVVNCIPAILDAPAGLRTSRSCHVFPSPGRETISGVQARSLTVIAKINVPRTPNIPATKNGVCG